MNSASVRRAKLARIAGLALMIAGLAPILWLAANSIHPMPIDPLAPLQRLPSLAYSSVLALAVSLPALLVMWLGATIAARQKDVLEAAQRAKQDRLRRKREYGSEERVEPYIGSRMTFESDKEPR
jgi:hypothetical protein